MKTTSTIISSLALTVAATTAAIASAAPTEVDTSVTYNSGILVLAFAGFLALVVVVQTIPAVITLYGMIKGAMEAGKEREATSTANNK